MFIHWISTGNHKVSRRLAVACVGPCPVGITERMPATPKAKRTLSPKAPAAPPNRSRTIQVTARLSEAEKRDLDELVARWEETAAAQGFAGRGFADWLRAVIRREKKASRPAT